MAATSVSPANTTTTVTRQKESHSNPEPRSRATTSKSNTFATITLEELREKEWEQIVERRCKAGVPSSGNREGPPQDLVGLSLSGGGVRSSMFGAGVLQGLHKIGLMKRVDYLATVSGGGFIGGFLTSRCQKEHEERKKQEDQGEEAPAASSKYHFPLEKDGGVQHPAVNQLMKNGGYLHGAVELMLRVVMGVALHLLIVASLLIFSCSFISLFWRIPDMSVVQQAFSSLAAWLAGTRWLGYALTAGFVTAAYLFYYSPPLYFFLRRRRKGETWPRLMKSKRKVGALAALIFLSILFIDSEGGFFAVYNGWYATSDFIRALIPLFFFMYLFGFLGQIQKVRLKAVSGMEELLDAHGKLLSKFLSYKNVILIFCFLLTVLTLFANGDTDLGERVGHISSLLFPSLGRESATSQVTLQIRNSQSIREWITTITQYLLFIQLTSGIIPLVMPRQFASSGHAGAGAFHRRAYRTIIFLLFISLPLVVCFMFLRENISGAVQAPSPIKRLSVSQDPTSGAYGYLIDHDQMIRARWFLAGLVGFLALNLHVNLNRTSLHQYYRRRLKSAYFDAFADENSVDPSEPDGFEETRLHGIEVHKTGAPYPLMVATLNETRSGATSLDSGCAFIFSPLYCGWSRNQPFDPMKRVLAGIKNKAKRENGEEEEKKKGYPREHDSCFIRTTAYRGNDRSKANKNPAEEDSGSNGSKRGSGLRLVDAMAVSGAAITPSNSQSILDTIILLAVNARLGQWFVNPGVGVERFGRPNDQEALSRRHEVFQRLLGERGHGIPTISVLQLIRAMLTSPGGGREICFLSDGAHYDNLGVETLFERRCRLIIASDASHDPNYEFADLSKTLRRLQAFWGIDFFFDRSSIENLGGGETKAPEATAASRLTESSELPGRFDKSSTDRDKSRSHRPRALVFAFRYPEEAIDHGLDENQRWGLFIVLKPSVETHKTRKSAGLSFFSRSRKTFPMDNDLNQFFDESQCEYYRELGEVVTSSLFNGKSKINEGSSLDDILREIGNNFSLDEPLGESDERLSINTIFKESRKSPGDTTGVAPEAESGDRCPGGKGDLYGGHSLNEMETENASS